VPVRIQESAQTERGRKERRQRQIGLDFFGLHQHEWKGKQEENTGRRRLRPRAGASRENENRAAQNCERAHHRRPEEEVLAEGEVAEQTQQLPVQRVVPCLPQPGQVHDSVVLDPLGHQGKMVGETIPIAHRYEEGLGEDGEAQNERRAREKERAAIPTNG